MLKKNARKTRIRSMKLPDRWLSFWVLLGAKGEPGKVFSDLDERYRGAGRFYHTWEHVSRCLDERAAVHSLCASPLAVELALWFHDAVYDPRGADNEQRSARLARDASDAMGINPALADLSARLILATAHGALPLEEEDGDRDSALVQDIDLAILGAEPRLFRVYEKNIRREYSFLAEEEYRKGRITVLGRFLSRRRIYRSDPFHRRYEETARRNLRASLASLGDQPR
jgi:predicted metal-dependent HD superfamily phosphohydrolase